MNNQSTDKTLLKQEETGYFISENCIYCIEEKLNKDVYFDEEEFPRYRPCEKHQKRFDRRLKEKGGE